MVKLFLVLFVLVSIQLGMFWFFLSQLVSRWDEVWLSKWGVLGFLGFIGVWSVLTMFMVIAILTPDGLVSVFLSM